MKGIKDMTEKNICQNPTCCDNTSKDRWNKKLNKFLSRKAYRKSKPTNNSIYEYFCTTSCTWNWLDDNLENIIERKHCPNKILDKIIRA